MDIRIGDIVRFLSDKMEGKVTGIIDPSTVNVFVDQYGFEIPASVNDLVAIHTDIARTSDKPAAGNPLHLQGSIPVQPTDTVYIAIVPDNFNCLPVSRFEFFIVNDTCQTCLYSVAFNKGEKYTGIAAGNCAPDSASSLGQYTLKEIDEQIKGVNVKAIFFQKGIALLKDVLDTEIRIHPANLCKSGAYKHTRWFKTVSLTRALNAPEPIVIEPIDEKMLREAVREKKTAETSPRRHPQRQENGNILEIDLHCNELLDTTAGMESKDILEYQLDVFRKTMEEHKLKKGKKIIFIHGKGDGVLRQRILWELQTKYKRHHHQDASFKQYGYGATMVTIK